MIQPRSEPQHAPNPSHLSSRTTCTTEITTTTASMEGSDVSVLPDDIDIDLGLETPSCLSEEDFLERVANELDDAGETHSPETWSVGGDREAQRGGRMREQKSDSPGEIHKLEFGDLEEDEEDWMHPRDEGEVAIGQDLAEAIGGRVQVGEERNDGSTGVGDHA